jgi:hypothetical protein
MGKTQAPNQVWTLVDCPGSGDAVIVNGCRFVNRLNPDLLWRKAS